MPEQWESFTELCNYFAFEGEIFDLCMSQFDMVMSHDIITLVDGILLLSMCLLSGDLYDVLQRPSGTFFFRRT